MLLKVVNVKALFLTKGYTKVWHPLKLSHGTFYAIIWTKFWKILLFSSSICNKPYPEVSNWAGKCSKFQQTRAAVHLMWLLKRRIHFVSCSTSLSSLVTLHRFCFYHRIHLKSHDSISESQSLINTYLMKQSCIFFLECFITISKHLMSETHFF